MQRLTDDVSKVDERLRGFHNFDMVLIYVLGSSRSRDRSCRIDKEGYRVIS